jgi:hypothetical protein
MHQQRLELRAEHQRLGGEGPVQRLLAQPVARQQQPATLRVPECQPGHGVDPRQQRVPFFFVEVHQHLGVGLRREAMPLADQFVAQLAVVVDLAVEDDDHRAVLVGYRLPTRRQIDDREPPDPQRHRTFEV